MSTALTLLELATAQLIPDSRWLLVAAYGSSLMVGAVVGGLWGHALTKRDDT